jgi:RNA polymerase sigma factor (sigma-70 family)
MITLNHLADDQLVKLFEAGNTGAFEVLLTRYKSKSLSYIMMVVRNRDLAEDIFQDTFVKAITTIKQGRYVETGKFLPWINRIAHNLIIDHYRRLKSENTVSADGVEYDLYSFGQISEMSVEDVMHNEQVLKDVVSLVSYLPENQQEVVRMRFFEQLSFKEIAEMTGVSINTSLGRMRYALINLRKMAEEKDIYLQLQ